MKKALLAMITIAVGTMLGDVGYTLIITNKTVLKRIGKFVEAFDEDS